MDELPPPRDDATEDLQAAAEADRASSGSGDEEGAHSSGREVPRQSFKRRHWGKLLLLTLAMLPVVVFAVWSVVTLNWTYSDGPRPGYVQKISHKGFVCKTWEGMLYTDPKAFRPDSFAFTVRNDSIAKLLQNLVGKQVVLNYEQHIGVPTKCFGDSEYFVVGVREMK